MAKKNIIRLDKFLGTLGVGTRSQLKNDIKDGRVSVNGETITRPETKIDTTKDVITYNNEVLEYTEHRYYMLHKPAGVVTATRDRNDRTIMDCIDVTGKGDMFPVGRLDKDTEGLLLITNDGELAHRLLSPKKHIPKTYYARIEGCVTEDMISKFENGLDIGDEKYTLPAKLEILSAGEQSEIYVTITEGRYHQVKRMFKAVGCTVIYLKRMSMGNIKLPGELEPGQFRALTDEEISLLKESVFNG